MSCDICYVLRQMALSYITLKVIWFLLYEVVLLGVFKWGHLDVGRIFKGDWVVITGATGSIGKAFAMKLASQGLNIMLISRSPAKLKELSDIIEEKYNVMTRIVVIDFTGDPKYYEEILRDAIGFLSSKVVLLINSVGISYDYPDYYADLEGGLNFVHNLIKCNITSLNVVTQVVLKAMLLNERKPCGRRGVIINMGSFASITPFPLETVYAASKAYVDQFSISLYGEYSSEGIVIQCLKPSRTVSKLSKVENPSLFVPSASDFVDSALSTLGVYSQTTGYWSHTVITYLANVLPKTLRTAIIFSILKNFRRREFAKKNLLTKLIKSCFYQPVFQIS